MLVTSALRSPHASQTQYPKISGNFLKLFTINNKICLQIQLLFLEIWDFGASEAALLMKTYKLHGKSETSYATTA